MNGGFKIIVTVVIAAIAMFFATPATTKANTVTDSLAIASDNKPSQVQYLGTTADGLWFDIKYANPKGEKFTLMIKNADGELLFHGSFSGANFSKKIKIVNEGPNSLTPTFIIKTADNKKIAQSIQVNSTSRSVEDVIVTRS
ncbi:hypothetical protein FLA_5402 [Filimonas lacunae]|nr:hypothetical protein FLA_5402 [Filimonas lacunae]